VKRWKAKDRRSLQSVTLASKVNALIKGFDHMKVSLENKTQRMQPLSLEITAIKEEAKDPSSWKHLRLDGATLN